MATTTSTHYDVLGVSPDSSYEDIKAAFYQLARTFHPDKAASAAANTENADNEFRRIQQAWQILRDTTKRKQYNDELQQMSLAKKAKQGGVLSLQWSDLVEAQDEETGETIHVYDCRCGEELIVEAEENDNDNTATPILVECPGCCFVYQIQR